MLRGHKLFFKYITLKNIFCLITILSCLLGAFKSMPITPAVANNEKIVRIGYYENPPFQIGAADDLTKDGYAYDYLQRLKLYNNWKYEYVYGSYGKLYGKLLNGEIDLLAGLPYTPERASIINYPREAMGETKYYFLKLSSNSQITSELSTINGKRIGVLKGAQVGVVNQYLSEHNLSAQLIEFGDIKERDEAIIDGQIDIMMAESDGTFPDVGIEVFADVGSSAYYLVANKARPDILEDLNKSQELMKRENPHFLNDLSRKWFKKSVLTTTLLPNERKWLAEHDTFKVGYLTTFLPYSAKDKSGNVVGVITDIVPEIFRVLGDADIKIEYIGYSTAEELINALHNQEVDVVFPGLSNAWISEQHDIITSEPVVNSNFNILYAGAYPDMSRARIAISRRNGIMDSFRKLFYPKNEVLYFDDIDDCMDAVKRGEADVIIVSKLRTEYLLRRKESYKDLNTAQLTNDVDLGFAGLTTNPEIIRLINHGLSLIDDDFALIHAYSYMPKHEVSLLNFFKNNIWVPLLGLMLFFSVIFYFVIRENRKNREHLAESEAHSMELSDKVEEISVLNNELQDRQARLEEYASETETHLMETKALNALLQEQQTKLEESIEAADAANKAKSTFLFNMSHDIRTPLNAIIGFTELGERDPDNIAKNTEYRQKIKNASHQLLDILNSILEMARIENKSMFIEEEITDANELFDSCLIMFEGDMRKKNLTLTSSFDIQHRFLYIDGTHMSEVVMNVISNAVKYTPDGGNISVMVKELPGDTDGECILEIRVQDTGIGMSKEFVTHIFEQFSRDRNSTQSGIQGTGLGMAIVKSLVGKMKGTIKVNSELGVGTEIIISTPHRIGELPSSEDNDQNDKEKADFSGKRILMAEDNDLNAEIATFVLEDAGFEVERAVDGIECFNMLMKHDIGYYDLILMDIQMPNLDGYGATEKIRRLADGARSKIPIVALTANAFKEDQEKAFAVGMNAHLAKPIDVEKTLATLQEILG